MTNFSAIAGTSSTQPATTSKGGFATLGQADFLRLLTTQMSVQDPFNPVDNKEMLAQMAQFSSLAGINDVNDTLKSISEKLDAVLSAQAAAGTNTPPAATTNPTT